MRGRYCCYSALLERYSVAPPQSRWSATRATAALKGSSAVAPGAAAIAGAAPKVERVAVGAATAEGLLPNAKRLARARHEGITRYAERNLNRLSIWLSGVALGISRRRSQVVVRRVPERVGAHQPHLRQNVLQLGKVGIACPHLLARQPLAGFRNIVQTVDGAREPEVDLESLLPHPTLVLAPRLQPGADEPGNHGEYSRGRSASQQVDHGVCHAGEAIAGRRSRRLTSACAVVPHAARARGLAAQLVHASSSSGADTRAIPRRTADRRPAVAPGVARRHSIQPESSPPRLCRPAPIRGTRQTDPTHRTTTRGHRP